MGINNILTAQGLFFANKSLIVAAIHGVVHGRIGAELRCKYFGIDQALASAGGADHDGGGLAIRIRETLVNTGGIGA